MSAPIRPVLGRPNKATLLYAYMAEHIGTWFTSLELTQQFALCAISTWISTIRRQLPGDVTLEHRQDGNLHSYRLVRAD